MNRYALIEEIDDILTIVNIVVSRVQPPNSVPANGLQIGMELINDVWTRPVKPEPEPENELITKIREEPELVSLEDLIEITRLNMGFPPIEK
jgi:hypothetical protein